MRVKFVVPGRTVSVNGTYRGAHGTTKSREAVAFQRSIAFRAKNAMRQGRKPFDAGVGVVIGFHAAHPLMDIDGPLKLTLDALQGVVYTNDLQVQELVVRKQLDREHPRLDVEVYSLEPAITLDVGGSDV